MVFLCLETWLFKGTFLTVFTVAHLVTNLPATQETGFDPWVRKIPWRRKWQSTPVFLPGECHGQMNLVGYSPWDCKESDTTERLTLLPDNVKNIFHNTIQFSCSVMYDSLRPHEPQHASPPCPTPTPRVHPNPCPLSP